jgi:DNA repair photolyase
MFRAYDQPFQILTKGGMLAAKDFDLYTPQDKFGVTLTFDNDVDSKKWEPGAALPSDRIAALKEARRCDVRTWVSMEPVIVPEQTLRLIELAYEFVDFFWVGKLNRKPEATWTQPEEWPTVDWPKFRSEVEEVLQRCGKEPGVGYKLKHQLIEAK